MGFPLALLGILAAGGAAAAHPLAKNRNQRIQGEYIEQQAAERGIDLQTAGPDLMRSFGLGTGTLGMPDAQRDVRTGFEGAQQRQQSDINSRRSAGVSLTNARNALEFQKQQYQDQLAGIVPPMTPYQQAQVDLGSQKMLLDAERYAAEQQQIARQLGMEQAQAYASEVEPLLDQNLRYQKVGDLLPQADRWTGDWFNDPASYDAKREAEQTLFELKQDWIQREISFGNEPNDALYKRADSMFPSSLSMFRSRAKLDEFIKTQMAENNQYIDRARVRFTGARTGNPTLLIDALNNQLYPPIDPNDVRPD